MTELEMVKRISIRNHTRRYRSLDLRASGAGKIQKPQPRHRIRVSTTHERREGASTNDKITYIEKPYICICCGKKNLKFTEIVFQEDADGQVDLSTVKCFECGFLELLPKLEKHIKPEEKEIFEKKLGNFLKQSRPNCANRTIRRAIKKP